MLPVLDDNLQSNVPGLYIVGDLAGAPVVKLAMEQGWRVARHIAKLNGRPASDPSVLDLLVVGAGAAGLNAALEARKLGLSVAVVEKGRVANTIAELPAGKWIYTEPADRPAVGDLPLRETTKEELSTDWEAHAFASGIPIYTGEELTGLKRLKDGSFEATTPKRTQFARRVILAAGKSSTPRRLSVPGEDRANVEHKLYNPNKYHGERILVVGGGNSAVEAAIALSANNDVTLSYRGDEFVRITRENARRLKESRVEVRAGTRVSGFGPSSYTINGVEAGLRAGVRPYRI